MNCKTANALAALAVALSMSAWVYWLTPDASGNFCRVVCEVKP